MTAQRPKAEQHPAPELLSEYALGRLSEAELEGIAEHLDQCDDCQETLTSLASEDTLVRGLAMEFPTASHESEAELAAVLESLKDQPRDETLEFDAEQANSAQADTPQTLRDYRLLGKLGSGGMGTVYRAKHERLGRLVALKVLPGERMRQPQAIARFAREMQAVGNLDHRHIVRAFDAGEIEGKHFLAMELIDGIDLSALSKQEGPLPVGVACELARQAALGLQYAHEQGLVHRDVKPSNLMLDCAGTVKVLDLGLARLLSDTSDELPAEDLGKESLEGSNFQTLDPVLTGTDQVMGTPDYMAPEQCTRAKVDARSDVFSLGATLYKLLAGHAPYSGSEFDTLAKKITGLSSRPVPEITNYREDLPKPLLKLLGQMLEKDPESRPQTAAEVAKSLESFASVTEVQELLATMHGETASFAGNTNPPIAVSPLSGFGRKWLIGAAFIGLLLTAIVLLKLQTPEGQLTVEVPPEARDQVQVEVRQGDRIKVFNPQEGWEAKLEEGTWEVTLQKGSDQFKLENDRVMIERDESQLVRILLDRKKTATQSTTTGEISFIDLSANPKRSDWPIDCAMYTKVYKIDDSGTIQLRKGLGWQVRPEYRGHSSQGPVVDPRITVALIDHGRGFWPIITKLSTARAEDFHADLRRRIEEFEEKSSESGEGTTKHSITAAMYLHTHIANFEPDKQGYQPDSLGRIELPRNVDLRVEYPYTAGGMAQTELIGLKMWDPNLNRVAWHAFMPLSTAKRFATQLSQVIETKKRSVAVKRPAPLPLASFQPDTDTPISKPTGAQYQDSWGFTTEEPKTIRLFEIEPAKLASPKELENCVVTYRAKLNTKDATGKVYLEMWCRVPPHPPAFSKGFHHAVTGTNGWATYETPFFLKKGEKADLLKLNVVTEGSGTIYLKDVEVIVSPMP